MRRVTGAASSSSRRVLLPLLLLFSAVVVVVTMSSTTMAMASDVSNSSSDEDAVPITVLPTREALLTATSTLYTPRPTLVLFTHDVVALAAADRAAKATSANNSDRDDKDDADAQRTRAGVEAAAAARAAVQQLVRALPTDYVASVYEFVVRSHDDELFYRFLGLPRARVPMLVMYGASIVRAGVASGIRREAPPIVAPEYVTRPRWWASSATYNSTSSLRAWALSVAPRRFVDAVTWRLLPALHMVTTHEELAHVVDALYTAAVPPSSSSGGGERDGANAPTATRTTTTTATSTTSSSSSCGASHTSRAQLDKLDNDEKAAVLYGVATVSRLPRQVLLVHAPTSVRGADELVAVLSAAAARSGGDVLVCVTESQRLASAFGITQLYGAAAVPFDMLRERLARARRGGNGATAVGDACEGNEDDHDAVRRRVYALDMRDVAQAMPPPPSSSSLLDVNTATAVVAHLCGHDDNAAAAATTMEQSGKGSDIDDDNDNDNNTDDEDRTRHDGSDARLRRAARQTAAQTAALSRWRDAVERYRTTSPLRKLDSQAAMSDMLYTLSDSMRIVFVLRPSDALHFARHHALAVEAATRLQRSSCVTFAPPPRRTRHGRSLASTARRGQQQQQQTANSSDARRCHTPVLRAEVFWLDAEQQDDLVAALSVRRVPAVLFILPIRNNQQQARATPKSDADVARSTQMRPLQHGVHVLNYFDLYSPRNDEAGGGQMPREDDNVRPTFPASADELLAFVCSRNMAAAASYDIRFLPPWPPRGARTRLRDEVGSAMPHALAPATMTVASAATDDTNTSSSSSSSSSCRANYCYTKIDYKYYHEQPQKLVRFVRDEDKATVTLPTYTARVVAHDDDGENGNNTDKKTKAHGDRTAATRTTAAARVGGGKSKAAKATAVWQRAEWGSELEQRRAAKEARVRQKAAEAARQREATVQAAAAEAAAARRRASEEAAAAAASRYVVSRQPYLSARHATNSGSGKSTTSQQQQRQEQQQDKTGDGGSRSHSMLREVQRRWANETADMLDYFVPPRSRANATAPRIVNTLEAPPPPPTA